MCRELNSFSAVAAAAAKQLPLHYGGVLSSLHTPQQRPDGPIPGLPRADHKKYIPGGVSGDKNRPRTPRHKSQCQGNWKPLSPGN